MPPRPGIQDAGRSLNGLAEVFTLAIWEKRGLDPRSGSVLRPLPGTPGDVRCLSELNPDNVFVIETVNWMVHATRDHLEGLAVLCATHAPLRTVLAVARVLLEPAMHVSYVLDEQISDTLRTVRAFNLRQEALRQEWQDAVQDPADDGEAEARARAERDGLSAAARADGLAFVAKKDGTLEGYVLEPRNEAAQMRTIALGPLGMDAWRTLSSATHSQERSHLRVALGDLGVPQGHATDWMALFWVYLAVEAAIHAIEATVRYLGGAVIPDTVLGPIRYMLRDAAYMVPDNERLAVASRLGWTPPDSAEAP
ncbi:hypothetical protein [Promicromonospora iranensis]|uniref:Uncharacterized protein n=1 Tax=Promicromonospora iranensis TaxID=1105144 RepID=A0ABU2CIP5_9MICO|nr:hypothetical protein [Promicromonospora iranensis]MDR7381194.1 hypothetical protein [Promicromonospora iranensis]